MPRAKGGSIPPPRVVIEPNHGGIIATLNENDVLCGRGGRINNHPGNITFRTVVEEYKREYLDPRTRKLEKAHVAARLVAQIRGANPPGRFLKDDPNNVGKYFEIGDVKAWKKAGQALREDAPDVRKEIGDELDANEKEGIEEQHNEHNENLFPLPPQHHPPSSSPPYEQQQLHPHPHHQQHHHHHHHQQQQQQQQHYNEQHYHQEQYILPPGIPPSVSYSPTSGPGLTSSSSGFPHAQNMLGSRPDPPEAPGVTGYRQPPLRYFESGRGSSSIGGGGPFSGRGGRGLPKSTKNAQSHHPSHHHLPPTPPHQQQYNMHPHTQGYPHPHQQNPQYFGAPPPYHHSHPQYSQLHHGQPQFQIPPSPQFQHPPPHPFHAGAHNHVQPQSQHSQTQIGGMEENGNNTRPHPQFLAPQQRNTHSRKKSSKSASPDRRDIVGINGLSGSSGGGGIPSTAVMDSYATHYTKNITTVQDANEDFPLTMSIGKEFTSSDISSLFDRQLSDTSHFSGKISRDDNSFTMSELLASNTTSSSSLGISVGSSLVRTRSFPPDLTVSSIHNDLLPPVPSSSDEIGMRNVYDGININPWTMEEGKEKLRTSSRGRTMRPFHRYSSSESSNHSMTSSSFNIKGFHPVRSRSNTAMSGINDAMSIMSLESRKSVKSDASSWLDNFRSFQSIHSDMNPWELAQGNTTGEGDLIRHVGDEGSLSDVSYDMNALDLAEPLLPPLSANDSYEFMKPDP